MAAIIYDRINWTDDATDLSADNFNHMEQGIADAVQGVNSIDRFNTAPIGSVMTWSGKTIPWEYALADGQRLSAAQHPDAYAFAQQEVAAGNTLWTVRASDQTFTVPNFTDKFIYGQGAKALGAVGGAETHLLKSTESGSPPHSHPLNNAQAYWFSGGGQFSVPGSPSFYNFQSTTPSVANNTAQDAAQAHNNMPPYVVLAHLVKVRGVSTSAEVIQGPQGVAGQDGAPSPAQFRTLNAGARSRKGPANAESGVIAAGSSYDMLALIAFTPEVNCVWRVEGSFIAQTLDGTWNRLDAWVRLDKADAFGDTTGAKTIMQNHPQATPAIWDGRTCIGTFALWADETYIALLRINPFQGNWKYWQGADHLQMHAHVTGFW